MKKTAAIIIAFCLSLAAFAQPSKLTLKDGSTLYVDFYADNIARLFHSEDGLGPRNPVTDPPAEIIVQGAKHQVGDVTRTMASIESIMDDAAIVHEDGKTTFSLKFGAGLDFYGGGIQNGRFSHHGKTIAIENQNSWTDGGVCSPAPWFWSTAGYGLLWNTFTKGTYHFGEDEIVLTHETPLLDVFIMFDDEPADLLRDYYQLTGAPVLLPKFGFYEGHLNAYNRDYWLESADGIPFEDGRSYVESQKDNGGIRESLNGEIPGGYQFSARAVIDRYEAAGMPLGWILPNDGYGAGYGQTETLDGNIDNLRVFGEYAHSKGVEIGLWTQSELHPVDTIPALLQRDIDKEVGVAGVRVLKTDVAWVHPGYSFGLNGIADAAGIMRPFARPFIITVDGWAGTQRYGGIWTGDQSGGQWEYIRFHIPTYIGSGLAGQPNIGSDMDGIFGGGNEIVNIRDFQWKTFTPMELNMDGWGSNPKYPQALGTRAADINRLYLKLKSELMPYTYSIAWEATHGLPMVRAMFLEEPNAFTYGTDTQYQFMYGPWFLVAPIYKDTAADAQGNDIRDNIYLPEGEWIDWFTGEAYKGGRVLCNFPAPIVKLPVFVKRGAIIPLTSAHNNPSQMDTGKRIYEIFPYRSSSFTEYDDDGRTDAYLQGEYATTLIECAQKGTGVTVTVHPAEGSFQGMVRQKTTVFRIHTSARGMVRVWAGRSRIKAESSYVDGVLTVTVPSVDITSIPLKVKLCGFKAPSNAMPKSVVFESPEPSVMADANSLELHWNAPANDGNYREVLFNGMVYTGIRGDSFKLDGLSSDTAYSVMYREGGLWKTLDGRTAKDPYEYAIKGITGDCTAPAQGGQEIERLFDFSTDTEVWHTQWYQNAVPFDITADLGAVYTLDKLEYVPRSDAGNGTLLSGSVSTSPDGKTWSAPVPFSWERSAKSKELPLGGVQAAFVRIHVDSATGGFGSGRELYIFRVPGTSAFRKGVFNDKGQAVERVD